MAAQIILIVDGIVVRDDGDVIRLMMVRIAQSTDHLDRMETQVASRRQVEDTELAALRADLERMKTDLQHMLTVPQRPTVDPAAVTALAEDIRSNTERIRTMVPDDQDRERTL